MRGVTPELAMKYRLVIKFLRENPDCACPLRGRSQPEIGTSEYIRRQAVAFSTARTPKGPQAPATVPDELVSVILEEYFKVPRDELAKAQEQHLLAMGAENLVGNLLERYIASVAETFGWIWCSGSVVRSVDFLKPPDGQVYSWRLLQIKNRDNSENSSSSAVRDGTTIEKWYRTFSRRRGSNWHAFPDPELRAQLSEDAFKDFVRTYLRAL